MIERHRPHVLRHEQHSVSLNGHVPVMRGIALPGTVNPFRDSGESGGPYWFGDDMGGIVDPSSPSPSRREFLIRAVVAATALTVGGAVNVLTMALARQSGDAPSAGASASERR